jgi:site-specific DNA-methyltransferase (adenine-specific)
MRYELCQGNCETWLDQIDLNRKIDCLFCDPPDGIGLKYNEYNDKMDTSEYIKKMGHWLRLFCEKADTVWFSFNSRWTLEIAHVARQLRDEGWEFKPCVQTFSFYQHCKTDLGDAHRPLWRFRKPNAGLYPEQAKIQSWRQKHGDSRATPGGKVPGSAFDFTKLQEKQRRDWHERAIEIGGYIVDPLIPDDHFDFTRVVGNSKQRRSWHPTQLNEGLVDRCVRLSTKPGDWVVDPFGGTGTTLRVCKKLGDRHCTLIELDPYYCQNIAGEHNMEARELGKWSRWELNVP